MTEEMARALLVGATALHLGFQATVTLLVYPALATTPAEHWTRVHARHSRRIVPLVGVVYATALAAAAGALIATPSWAARSSVGFTAAALATTALAAAPVHGRLQSPDPALLARLLRVDRVRTACAGAALVLALIAL